MAKATCYNVDARAWTEIKVLAIVQGITLGEALTRAINLYAERVHNGGKKSKPPTS